MPAGFERVAWFGPGPEETYSDRKWARVGAYSGSVDEQWTEYSRPQENGNKADARWMAVTNADGVGLLAVGMPLLSAAARHYTHADLVPAHHTWDARKRPEVFVNLDFAQMGVGGDDSWGALPHQQDPACRQRRTSTGSGCGRSRPGLTAPPPRWRGRCSSSHWLAACGQRLAAGGAVSREPRAVSRKP